MRMVLDHGPEHPSQWAAIQSVAEKLGCRDETLRRWVRQAERDAGIAPSVGSTGDAYDNALAETVIGLFKTEVIQRRGPWRSLEMVEFAVLTWVHWFNTGRLLEPLGYIPPAEYEARYYEQAKVA